jgi:D-sedoheptulose 7-phosphate isomerase
LAPLPDRDTYSSRFMRDVAEVARTLPVEAIEDIVRGLAAVRERGGRLFVIGVGGGAAHASHAVNDFRKLCRLEAYAPTDNVSELTARANDEGFDSAFAEWLRVSRMNERDALLVFSVGGGSREKGISVGVVRAVELAREVGAQVFGVVGRSDGATALEATSCVVVPAPPERITPLVEGFQAIVWHAIVSHPALALAPGKWESLEREQR